MWDGTADWDKTAKLERQHIILFHFVLSFDIPTEAAAYWGPTTDTRRIYNQWWKHLKNTQTDLVESFSCFPLLFILIIPIWVYIRQVETERSRSAIGCRESVLHSLSRTVAKRRSSPTYLIMWLFHTKAGFKDSSDWSRQRRRSSDLVMILSELSGPCCLPIRPKGCQHVSLLFILYNSSQPAILHTSSAYNHTLKWFMHSFIWVHEMWINLYVLWHLMYIWVT